MHEENELTTLRMSHKVDGLVEQQKNIFNALSSFRLPENKISASSSQSKPKNSTMNVFHNIFRKKIEDTLTRDAALRQNLEYFVTNFP